MDKELIREVQQYYEAGEYLQIVLRLVKFDVLPAGLDVAVVIEAILQTFRASSDTDDIRRASILLDQLEDEGHLNKPGLDKLFHDFGDIFLSTEGEKIFHLESVLMGFCDEDAAEKLIKLYARAKTREQKVVLARWIGSSFKEMGLLVLVDNLYSQKLIGNGSIRAILEKYSLLEVQDLKSEECEAIVSAVLGYLGTPGPRIENMADEKKYKIDDINRTCAARILVVLNRFPKLSKISRLKIQIKRYLIVTYHCVDRMHDIFEAIRLGRYLSGGIN